MYRHRNYRYIFGSLITEHSSNYPAGGGKTSVSQIRMLEGDREDTSKLQTLPPLCIPLNAKIFLRKVQLLTRAEDASVPQLPNEYMLSNTHRLQPTRPSLHSFTYCKPPCLDILGPWMAVSPLTETLQSAAHQTHKHNSSGGPTNTPHKTKGFKLPCHPRPQRKVEGINRTSSFSFMWKGTTEVEARKQQADGT